LHPGLLCTRAFLSLRHMLGKDEIKEDCQHFSPVSVSLPCEPPAMHIAPASRAASGRQFT
jgi:hypothetical protein